MEYSIEAILRKTGEFARSLAGGVFAQYRAMAPELVLGRWLAFCAHPIAAWRLLPATGKCLIALSYAAISYAAALGVLVLLD